MSVIVLLPLLGAPVWALLQLGTRIDPWIVGSLPLALSIFCYAAIHRDKQQARAGAWRTPEAALHLGELCGGWPGSFLAQWRYRHKVAKVHYQFTFWAIVLLHQFLAVDFLRGWQGSSRALAWVAGLLR